MRRCTSLNANETGRKFLEECQNVAPLQLTADYHLALRINAVDLKNRFGDVETDCRDRLHDWLLRISEASNSTHIHGTRVPVEEPSTASGTDPCTAARCIGQADPEMPSAQSATNPK